MPDRGGITSPLVAFLLRALARCGGPVPRPPQINLITQDNALLSEPEPEVGEQAQEEVEWLNGVKMCRSTWHWREAASLQRRVHVRQYLPVIVDYDPDLKWETALAQAVVEEAVPRQEREPKRQRAARLMQ